MTATYQDLRLLRNAPKTWTYAGSGDWTGYTATAEFYNTDYDTTPFLALSLGSGLTIDGPNAQLTVNLTSQQTSTFPLSGEYEITILSDVGVDVATFFGVFMVEMEPGLV